MMEIKIAYICDAENHAECPKDFCYLNGGECRHTEDIKHAKNFRNNGEYYIEEIKDGRD